MFANPMLRNSTSVSLFVFDLVLKTEFYLCVCAHTGQVVPMEVAGQCERINAFLFTLGITRLELRSLG